MKRKEQNNMCLKMINKYQNIEVNMIKFLHGIRGFFRMIAACSYNDKFLVPVGFTIEQR